jgi:hypothetical protein
MRSTHEIDQRGIEIDQKVGQGSLTSPCTDQKVGQGSLTSPCTDKKKAFPEKYSTCCT